MSREVAQRFSELRGVMNERVTRMWSGAEAKAIGRGGLALVARATGMSRTTIRVGKREINGETRGELANVRRAIRTQIATPSSNTSTRRSCGQSPPQLARGPLELKCPQEPVTDYPQPGRRPSRPPRQGRTPDPAQSCPPVPIRSVHRRRICAGRLSSRKNTSASLIPFSTRR
jgi:hypothetical protein